MEFMMAATELFKVVIFSSRSHQWGGRRAMKTWLIAQFEGYFANAYPDLRLTENPFREGELIPTSMAEDFVSEIGFPLFKPPAFLSIDDRGYQFNGSWPNVVDLLAFKPWNKRIAQPIKCPKCNQVIDETLKYCEHCGNVWGVNSQGYQKLFDGLHRPDCPEVLKAQEFTIGDKVIDEEGCEGYVGIQWADGDFSTLKNDAAHPNPVRKE
jgi:hypothetical protein